MTERKILDKIKNDKSEIAIGDVDYETRDVNISFPVSLACFLYANHVCVRDLNCLLFWDIKEE